MATFWGDRQEGWGYLRGRPHVAQSLLGVIGGEKFITPSASVMFGKGIKCLNKFKQILKPFGSIQTATS